MANLKTFGILVAAGLISAALVAQTPAPAPAPTAQQVEHRGGKNIQKGVHKQVAGQREVDKGKAKEAKAGREEAKADALRNEGRTGAANKLDAKAARTEAKGKAEVHQGRVKKVTGRQEVAKGEHQEAKAAAMPK